MKKIFIFILLFMISIISIFPLIVRTNLWGHDSQFHVSLISDIAENISLTNPFPKITSNVANGIGYGTHLFYPPLPHYFSGYLHLLMQNVGFSASDTLALTYFIISLLSSYVIFKLSFTLSKKKSIALLSSIIFLLMPYRISNIITRSAFNEVFVFLFFSLILLSLENLLNDKKFLTLFVIGFTGMFLSHLPLSLFGCLFILIWGLLHIKKLLNKDKIKNILIGILLVSVMVLPYFSLLLSQLINGNYLVFQKDYISSFDTIEYFKIPFISLFIPVDPIFKSNPEFFGLELKTYDWEVMYFINTFVLISLALTILFKKIKKNNIYYIILTIITIFMCTNISVWKCLPSVFWLLQFPWRLEVFLTIALSIISPLWISKFKNNIPKGKIVNIFIIVLLLSSIPLIQSLSRYTFVYEEFDYNAGMGHSKEYLPVTASENYYNNIDSSKIKYNGYYTDYSNINYIDANTLTFNVTSEEKETIIEIPRLYYAGYKLTDNKNRNIDFYENENGMIEFIANNGTFQLKYVGPLIYRLLVILRNIFIILILVQFIIKNLKLTVYLQQKNANYKK